MPHTNGPWTTRIPKIPITRLAAEDRMILAKAFDGSQKAIVDRVRGGTPQEANANALLIAAAPDMLAALYEVLHHADDECGFMVSVRSAIVKAIGS